MIHGNGLRVEGKKADIGLLRPVLTAGVAAERPITKTTGRFSL